MKISDIITEGKDKDLPKTAQAGAVHAMRFDDLDTYYHMYRFGIAMANHNADNPPVGPARDKFTVWSYTDGEEQIVRAAEKNMGTKGTELAKAPSSETENIYTVSPVPKKKRNKYGV